MAIYRPLLENEILAATEVFIETVNNLADRNGLPRPPFTIENRLPLYQYIFSQGQFLCAEEDGKIVAVANSILREKQWFLSSFWTLPTYQGRGIGRPLLRKLWDLAQTQGAHSGFTWSSIDFSAVSAYLDLGLYPLGQIFTLMGNPTHLPSQTFSQFRVEKLEPETANSIDALIRGCRRAQDHNFFAGSSSTALQIRNEQGPVGYFYCQKGVIGPVAWTDDSAGEAILTHAMEKATSQAPEVRIVVPGMNHTALRFARARGLKISSSAHLLATETFGKLSNYIPSGPLLF